MHANPTLNPPYNHADSPGGSQVASSLLSSFACVYFFAAGCLIRIDVHLLGRLAIGELLLVAYAPFAMANAHVYLRSARYQRIAFTLGLWVLGVVISDIVNNSEFEFFLRGVAKPILCLLLLFSCVHLASRDSHSLVCFFFGVGVSGIINFLVPTDFRAVEIAKNFDPSNGYAYSYYAYIYTPAVYAIASIAGYWLYRFHPIAGGSFQIFIGALAIPLLSRTTGSVLMLSGAIIIATHLAPGTRQIFFLGNRVRRGVLLKFSAIAVIAFCGTYYLYAYLASNELIGEQQYRKYMHQSTATKFGDTPLGILASGRHYTVGAILRITDHPLFGAGSWPKTGDTLLRSAEISGREFDFSRHDPNTRDIGHSILFGIWAQNGPLVLPFMLLSFAAVIHSFLLLAYSDSPLKALIIVYLITFIFGFFFNNFNSLARVLMVLMMVFLYGSTTYSERTLGRSERLQGGTP